MFYNTLRGVWADDFWEHTAALREFTTHSINPLHPFIAGDIPFMKYSPYLLILANLSNIFHLNSVTIFSIAGIFNLIFLLLSLRWFIRLIDYKNGNATSFFALIFILVLWGDYPWMWSGFFHLHVLGYVLPYSSTFATATMFLSFSVFIKYLNNKKLKWLILLSTLTWIIVLTHPLTSIVFFTGIFFFLIDSGKFTFNLLLYTALSVILIPFIGAILWPYYPFLDLLLHQAPDFNSEFHTSHENIHKEISSKIYPSLIGIPICIYRLKKKKSDALVWILIVLSAISIICLITKTWMFGRVISFIMIILQIIIAIWVSEVESKALKKNFSYIFLYVSIICFTLFFANKAKYIIKRSITKCENDYDKYAFLSQFTKQYDIILSDINTSLIVPVFGGKVVATGFPLPWVMDLQERRNSIEIFFSDSCNEKERIYIINRYHANFILINKKAITSPIMINDLNNLGKQIYSDQNFILIKLK